ncbi:LysE family translocator [Actinomadura sp. SCN-SB]|uniref:LysE family translocator n=1 Tax=Actinomadura sp. SCN-SB TaxID=3373092 RepID=UPI0037538AE2
MVTQLLGFIGVSVAVICTPGPDTALTVRNALADGRRGGIWTAAGISLGQCVWTIAASVGIAGLVYASEPAFLALKYLGAAYLIFLGVQSLRSAWRGGEDVPDTSKSAAGTPLRALSQGLINDLANPKMAAFFMSLLPQFAPSGGGALPVMLALGLVFCLLTFAWLVLYSVVIDKARALIIRAWFRRGMDMVAGGVLVAFGARLALADR